MHTKYEQQTRNNTKPHTLIAQCTSKHSLELIFSQGPQKVSQHSQRDIGCPNAYEISSKRHLQIFEYKSNDEDHCVLGSQQTIRVSFKGPGALAHTHTYTVCEFERKRECKTS